MGYARAMMLANGVVRAGPDGLLMEDYWNVLEILNGTGRGYPIDEFVPWLGEAEALKDFEAGM